MFDLIKKYPKAFVGAIAGHLILLSLFVVSFQFSKLPEPELEVDVVKATAIDEKQVQAELDKLRDREQRREDRVRKLEEKADQAKKQREVEQERFAELEVKNKQESEKKKQLEKERKRAEDAVKEASEKKRVAEQKAREAEDDRRRIEEERLAAELERKRVEEIAQKAKEDARRALESQRLAEEQKLREQQMREESDRMKKDRDRQVMGTVNRYVAMIKQRVEKNWIEPGTMKPELSCTVFVRMMPSGDVLDVKITKSSGDRYFDDSVETAVRRAAPLPLPPDASLFSHFRELEFVFKPDKKK